MYDEMNEYEEFVKDDINFPLKQINEYGVVITPEPIYQYPKEHPCYGCVHIFKTSAPTCSIGCYYKRCEIKEFEKRIRKKG